MPHWLELFPVELPGHGARLSEPPRTDLRRLVVELTDELQSSLDMPFAILGHSMGTWLALEITRELRRRRARIPELLIVVSGRPPHLKLPNGPLHQLTDDELVAAVARRYDGVPRAVRDSPELLQLLLPGLRADLQMLETYEYRDEAPLAVAMFVLGGADDRAVSPADLGEWRRHTTGDFAMRLTPGGHFALFHDTKAQPSEGLSIVIARLERCKSQATKQADVSE
jgi:medium-chain acyl-[acyl-carrier-protein] hydrolase